VLRKTLKRVEVMNFFANLRPCLIGMEACGSAHFWARKLSELGHTVKLMAPQFVKSYVKTNKNDARDAEAICEAVGRPNMRFVPVKTVEQQGLLSLHRARQGFVAARTVASIRVRAEPDGLILVYRHRSGGEEWKDEQYPVRIARTPCHLGGSRPWFICPAVGCGRRVAILYGGSIFACRHCYQLVYASSREEAGDRATRQADRLRARLGWEPGILNAGGGKPKWMRWRTFERLTAQHDDFVAQSLAVVAQRLGIRFG